MEEKIETKNEKVAEKVVETKSATPKTEKVEDVKEEKKTETKKEDTKDDKQTEVKKPAEKRIKRDEAVVRVTNLDLSTKYAVDICKFIKYKTIEQAIAGLELAYAGKKAIPMKGEIPHQKGKGMMSGRFPKRASEEFIGALKSLKQNAIHWGIDDPVITEAIANIGQRPYARGGIRRKRTHLTITAKNKKSTKNTKKKKLNKTTKKKQ